MVAKLETEQDIEPIDNSRNVRATEEVLEGQSKGQLIKLAGQLRDRRNELNQEASKRASYRDELNTKTREMVDTAQKHRDERDNLNDQVQEHKQERNQLNAKANDLFEQIEQKKRDLELDQGKGLDELEEEIEQLEFKQQTQVLAPEDERTLIDRIDEKRGEYRERKEKLEKSGELDELVKEAEAVRERASSHHEKVTQLAEQAQRHHNKMIEAYRAADEIRAKADDIHELFVEAQELADRHHEDFVQVQKRLRALDKREEQARRSEREKRRAEAKEEAEEIYEKFKQGETLETEDLMKLQRAGLL